VTEILPCSSLGWIYNPTAPRLGLGYRPQRKNETVIQTCMQCGAINGAEARTCCFCDTRLSKGQDATAVPARSQLTSEGNLAVEPDWRSEVSQRLEAYRVRRGRPRESHAQPALAFIPPTSPEPTEVRVFEAPPAAIPKRRFRPTRVERMEISAEQPSFDFAAEGAHDESRPRISPYDSPALSVAPLAERRRAGMLDVALLLFAYGAFLMLFHACGGRFTFSKVDALVTAATLGLFYTQYVTLFTYFGAATPGMTLRGLRVVSLDGLDPSPQQLLWRSFGYLVSAGTMMLGFLWALWDEDQLSWHDRISQTCITTSDNAAVPTEACSEASVNN
jgi:uncharacterized RDD family membrane protein YckC